MNEKYFKKELKKIKPKKNKYFYPLNSDNMRNEDLLKAIKVIFSRQMTMSTETLKFEETFKKN